jgi:hypothetical protein
VRWGLVAVVEADLASVDDGAALEPTEPERVEVDACLGLAHEDVRDAFDGLLGRQRVAAQTRGLEQLARGDLAAVGYDLEGALGSDVETGDAGLAASQVAKERLVGDQATHLEVGEVADPGLGLDRKSVV